MTCEEALAQVTALLDGELEPETAAEIEAHLAGCAPCAAARNEMAAVLELANVWRVEGVGVTAGVQLQIQQEEVRALLLELQSLRSEVASLRSEVTDLRRKSAKSGDRADREASVLQFPFAKAKGLPGPIL